MPLHRLSHVLPFRGLALRRLRGLCLPLVFGAGAALAQTALPAQAAEPDAQTERVTVPDQLQRDAQRARIAAARAEIAERLREQETACYQRFAVEDCLRAARSQARAQGNSLRQQEQELNAIERREKSAARLRAIEQKTQETDQGSAPGAPVQGQVRAPLMKPSTPRDDAPTPQDLVEIQAERAQAARQRAEAQSRRQQALAEAQARKQAEAARSEAARKRYEEKQREAQEKRERQRANAAKNAATRAAPLPAPPAAP